MPEYLSQERMEKELPHKVYYVHSPEDKTVLVAIDVKISDGKIQWFDTTQERLMSFAEIKDAHEDGTFSFDRTEEEGGATYYFEPMSLEIFEDNVKDTLIIPEDFTDEESLIQAFERTRQNGW